MVFQDDAVFPWYTVLQNVEYGLRIRKVPKQTRRAQARELIELVGLGGWEHFFPAQLSGGMRKRVDVARALAIQPEILLMDEPFAALDAITKGRMQEEFLRMWRFRNSTVLFVTHDVEEALFLGDRIVVMGAGRIIRQIPVPFERPRTAELRTAAELQEMRGQVIEYFHDAPQ
jgi:NitT/TauT family transport system ATP-binding protein